MLPDGAAPFGGKNGEDMSVKFDQAGVYGVKYLPLLRNWHGGHHRGRHADKHRAGQGGAAGQQGRADVCEAVREHENPSSPSPSRGSPVCRSRAFATIKLQRHPTASGFFLPGLIDVGALIPLWPGVFAGDLRQNAIRPTGGKGSGLCIRPFRTGPAGLRWKVPVFTWLAGCIAVFLSASIGCAAPYAIDAACLAFLATRIVAAVSGPTSMTASGKS